MTIDSGAEVSFDLLDGGYNQFTEKSTTEDVPKFDAALGDPAIGPVYVNGAEPGMSSKEASEVEDYNRSC